MLGLEDAELNQTIEDDIEIENIEELTSLKYEDNSEEPIFNKVRVTKKDFSIFELYRKYKIGKLILEVGFQRNYVWSPKQQSELIESILMGLPLPIFYFKQRDDVKYVVVDGKQRLSTLFMFFEDKFALKNLTILKFLNGCKYSDLQDELGIYQSQLEDYQVYSHVILPPTPDKILYDIFDRVNRGGTKLNKQEIRNALYQGMGLDMITEITRTQEFIDATRIMPDKDKRMKGSYLLTRFLAFYLLYNNMLKVDGKTYIYYDDMDDLIEITLEYLNMCDYAMREKLKILTCDCLAKSYTVLGKGAFRKELNQSKPINMNIFETTMYFMSLGNLKDSKCILQKIRSKLYNVITDEMFLYSIGNSRDNRSKVDMRFNMMAKVAEEVWND